VAKSAVQSSASPLSAFQSSVVPLGMTAVAAGGAPPARRALSFAVQHQLQTQWCWAAVTVSVAGFYRIPGWTQCRIVNDRLGRANCCTDGSSDACNQPGFLDKALSRVGNLGGFSAGALSLQQIQTEIDAGRPIGVRIGWTTGGGHFIAVAGYSDQNIVDVQDPWFGPSAVDYNAFRLRYHGSGRWTHSYRTAAHQGQNAPATTHAATQRL
jgi:papain like cysteine protease AvrRpt2